MKDILLLGVDIGTSSCKLTVINANGEIIAVGKAAYKVYTPAVGHYEQNAEDYWKGTLDALQQIEKAQAGILAKIQAIGVIGQTSTEIFVDKDGHPLRPAIIWKDTRATAEAEAIKKDFGEKKLFELLGAHVPISANWAASRLLWVSRNQPEITQKTYKILQPKDYINFKLTGEYFSDKWINKSVAHTVTGEIPEDYIRYLGFSPEVIPPLLAPYDICGKVTDEMSELTGLAAGTPVVVGWSDGPATMLGSGAFEKPGIAFNCTGTSEIVGMSVEDTQYVKGLMTIPKHLTGSVAVIYGPTQSGSSSLLWYTEKIGCTDFDGAVQAAATAVPGCDGLTFLPYLSGERAPLWDPSARGTFANIHTAHDAGSFSRAIMEGVAYSVRHCIETAISAAGIQPSAIRLSGGGSRIPLWCQIRADICKLPIKMVACDETSAMGAVMLAGVGIGLWENLQQASVAMVHTSTGYTPQAENFKIYDQNYYRYRELYHAMRRINEETEKL